MSFKSEFAKFVYEGDSITCDVGDLHCVATLYRDDCGDSPDERDCGHARAVGRVMRESDIKHEAGAYWVGHDRKHSCFVVYKNGATHATSDSAYRELDLAIARCDYLAKRDYLAKESLA